MFSIRYGPTYFRPSMTSGWILEGQNLFHSRRCSKVYSASFDWTCGDHVGVQPDPCPPTRNNMRLQRSCKLAAYRRASKMIRSMRRLNSFPSRDFGIVSFQGGRVGGCMFEPSGGSACRKRVASPFPPPSSFSLPARSRIHIC